MTHAAMTRAALKGVATAPRLLGSVAILLVVGPLVPAWAGFGLGLGVVAVLVVATGRCESTAARVLRGAQKVTPEQERLLAPVVTDLSASGNWPAGVQVRVLPAAVGVDVGATGRDTLLVTGGLLRSLPGGAVSRAEVAALLAHGLGRLAAGNPQRHTQRRQGGRSASPCGPGGHHEGHVRARSQQDDDDRRDERRQHRDVYHP